MPAELNLPDLPEVPLRLPALSDTAAGVAGVGGARPIRQPLGARLREAVVSYLPLLLMAVLALGTWWLVQNTPVQQVQASKPLGGGVPDYTMQGFALERFAPDGRLVARIEGDVLRHFPQDDRIEIDRASIHAWSAEGVLTVAQGQRARITRNGEEVELLGGARVEQPTQALWMESEYLRVDTQAQTVQTPQPVRVWARGSQFSAGALQYDRKTQRLDLGPPLRATLLPQSRGALPPHSAEPIARP
jgi:lipopolysaccharide export system protein LptC